MSTEGRINSGQFPKGVSGNLSGRPLGSRNQVTILMESLLEGEAEQLIRKAIELGKAGDTRALALCLSRMIPSQKDRLVRFEFPPIRSLDDIPVGMMSIMAAISEGSISPQEGETLSRILTGHSNALIAADVLKRVEKLEQGPSHDDNKVTIVKDYR
jgi:Family of unknown function (DUF5681)